MPNYFNLTQTLHLRNYGNTVRYCYFRSTDIEQKNWKRLLWSVPDEMLYFMSRNNIPIQITDASTKVKGKIERIFVPVLNDLFYSLRNKNHKPLHPNLKFHLELAKKELEACPHLRTKFLFWAKQAV